MWSSKMAAQWRTIDGDLNAGNVDFLSTGSPCQIGPSRGDNCGEDMDTQSCVEHSILAIFEDSAVSSEDTRQAEEESDTLLSALTQMLECVEDDVSSNLSPFDTLPDTKLLNYQEFGNSMTTDEVAFATKLRPRAKNDAGKEDKSKVARLHPVFRQESQTLFQGTKKKADTEVDVFTSSSLVNLVKLMHPYCLKMRVEEEGRGHRSRNGLSPLPWNKLEKNRTIFSQGEVWKYEKPTGDSDEDINVVSDDNDTPLKGTEEDKERVAKKGRGTLLKSALLTGKSSRGLFSREKKRVSFGPVQVASFELSMELFNEKNLPSVASADTPEGPASPALVAPAAASKSADIDNKAEEPLPKCKAKSLSLQEYRQLRQKRQLLVEKKRNNTTKWPSVPQPPKELTPIICSHGQRQTLCAIKSSPHHTEQSRISTYPPQRATCHHPPRPVEKMPLFAGKHHRFKYLQTESKSTSSDGPKSNDEHTDAPVNGAASRKNPLKNQALLSTDPPNPVLIRLPVSQTPAPSDSHSPPVSTVELSVAASQIQLSTEEPQPSWQVESQCPVTPQTSSECRKPQNLMLEPNMSHSLSLGPVTCDQGQPVSEALPEDPLRSSPPKKPQPSLQHTCHEQSAAAESGIEASDLTSLLEQFEEKQAKEEEEAEPASVSNALPSILHEEMERTSTLLETSTKEQEPVRTLYSVTPKSTINDLERRRKSEHVTPEPLSTEVILDTEVNVRRKTLPSKGIQIIDPRPLPSRRANASELAASPHMCSSVSVDHDYCLPVDYLHTRAPSSLLKNTCEVEEASVRKSESLIRAEEKYQSASSTYTDLAPSSTPLTPPPSPPSRGREKRRYTRRTPLSDSSCSSSSSSSSASRSPKRRRSRHKRSGSRSWSSSPSRSVSRSPPRRQSSTRLRCNRSRSRSWSRSGSPSPSSTNFCTCKRNIYSRESWKLKREHKARLQKLKAIDERRVVYVGRIRRSMTHDELRERFSHFGEVECVSLHFRDKGDHYGFVTFYNTDDAFSAIDNGGKLRRPDELPFDICFGGRRQFCNSDYADLVGALDTAETQRDRNYISTPADGPSAMTTSTEVSETARTGTKPFIGGVIEGFYGRPWTMEQRTKLFKSEQKWGLNTYLYAPKDDYKHRMYWRDLYSPEEAEQLIALISAAKKHNIDFIYAISPGLDVTFSNRKEVAALKRKLDQVRDFGCSSFSLLFDDIETEMCPADKQAFSSFGHAQVAITNEVYRHLGEPETFLFCPTDYCAAFCSPNVFQSFYLHTVGDELLPGIDVLWTGPKVVSHKISVESIEEVSSILKRAPVIWDNIHANDYDPQRIFMGPYKDRPTELIPKLRGVLTNPNCEFYPNFVPIHTLATWCKASAAGAPKDVEMGDEEQDPGYSPHKALTLALTDWLEEFLCTDQPTACSKKESCDEEPMQTDLEEHSYIPGPGENPLYTADPLTLDDLKLLSDLFYLPYEHGATAKTMLRELDWLKCHSQAAALKTDQTAEWCSRARQFDNMCEAVVRMFNRLSNVPNRRILYDLYNYICDIKSGVNLAQAYVKSLGGLGKPSAQLVSADPEPWGFRGGLSGEFQRMLPGHGNRDLFKHPPRTSVYCIRPYCAEDTRDVQSIFVKMQRERQIKAPSATEAPLISDILSTGEISPSPECALVLEDDIGVCGYMLALTDAKAAAASIQRDTSDGVFEDFPSLVTGQVLPRVADPSPAKRMIGQLLSTIRTSGSRGVLSHPGTLGLPTLVTSTPSPPVRACRPMGPEPSVLQPPPSGTLSPQTFDTPHLPTLSSNNSKPTCFTQFFMFGVRLCFVK
ncbi:uncharacterized protein LOC133476450 isoform X3 [Phyllopteryx taeniolatus]|uniref:uncharacterized protein LOC133476450 isoform X3 n=1 Tax=Phyllopteryx taeniolatus TaxID=161469 RepID=UPI002AD52E4E|nr:uncharacterized protein LOC133476450 isoform X3 [Phyllopteryx taeniolatus]